MKKAKHRKNASSHLYVELKIAELIEAQNRKAVARG